MPPKGSGKKNDAGAAGGSSSSKPAAHKEKLAIEVRTLSRGWVSFNDMAQ